MVCVSSCLLLLGSVRLNLQARPIIGSLPCDHRMEWKTIYEMCSGCRVGLFPGRAVDGPGIGQLHVLCVLC